MWRFWFWLWCAAYKGHKAHGFLLLLPKQTWEELLTGNQESERLRKAVLSGRSCLSNGNHWTQKKNLLGQQICYAAFLQTIALAKFFLQFQLVVLQRQDKCGRSFKQISRIAQPSDCNRYSVPTVYFGWYSAFAAWGHCQLWVLVLNCEQYCLSKEGRKVLVQKSFTAVPNMHDVREKIILLHHDTPHAGHQGRDKTVLLTKQNYWWPFSGLKRCIETCNSCQRDKVLSLQPACLLQPLPAPEFNGSVYQLMQQMIVLTEIALLLMHSARWRALRLH